MSELMNTHLAEMLGKLETKLKREVQQRIESQRKLHKHLHDTGASVEHALLTQFDEEIGQLQGHVSELEDSLAEWEPEMLS